MMFMYVRLFMLFIRESLFIVFTQERLCMLFMFVRLIILFITESLFSFHKGKIVYAVPIYMYGVLKLNKLMLYYFYTYIFDFILYFSCLNCCIGR
jgi:hypothetical protein